MNRFQRLITWLGRQRWWSWLMSHTLPRVDRAVHRITGGRRTVTELVLPVFLLTTTGRRTGEARETPLTYLELERGWAVAASSFGRGGHPAWSHNLIAHPTAEVTIDGRAVPVRAHLVEDEDEHARLLAGFIALYPPYRVYRERTSHRGIRMFVLEPVE